MDQPNEEAGFLESPGRQIYCFRHSPPAGTPSQVPTAVFVHPLMEERKSAYGTMAVVARELARQGTPCVRFDFRGTGESPGDFSQVRLAGMEEDLAQVCAAARAWQPGRPVGLIGLRVGGTIAIRAASRIEGVSRIAALAPVFSGAAQVRQWRQRAKVREAMTRKEGVSSAQGPSEGAGVLDLDGYPVSAEFLRDIESLDLASADAPPSVRLLLAQISHRPSPAPETEALAKRLGGRCRAVCHRIEPFWDRIDDVNVSALIEDIAGFWIQ